MNGPAGEQAPEQRRSAWPRAKLGATSSTAGMKHNTPPGPAAYHITESDGYPHSAAGALASAQARPILLGASGPFDGLAHEPRRHGVQLACVGFLDAPAGLEASSIRPASWTGTTVGLTNVVPTVLLGRHAAQVIPRSALPASMS